MTMPVKFLRALKWLSGQQAILMLQQLTGHEDPLPCQIFVDLVNSNDIAFYIDPCRLGGWDVPQCKYQMLPILTEQGDDFLTLFPDEKLRVWTGELESVEENTPGIRSAGSLTIAGLNDDALPVEGSPLATLWRPLTALFKPTDIQTLADIINGTEQRATDDAEVERLRRRITELEAKIAGLEQAREEAEELRQELEQYKQQEAEPSPKTRNAYLRTIAAMGSALVSGLTGKHHTDAEAILSVLASNEIEEPVGKAALSDYLKEAYKIKY